LCILAENVEEEAAAVEASSEAAIPEETNSNAGRKRVAEEEDHEDASVLKRSKKGNFILDFDIIKSCIQEKLR
jgi:hypothetical protein